jgi:four helix bundle protein
MEFDSDLPIEERFEHLPAWQAAMALVMEIYRVTEQAVLDDPGGVAIQLRATAITVPGKIAAGVGSGDPQLLVDNLSLAYAALSELRTLFYVATDMEELDGDDARRLAGEVARIGKLIARMTDNLPAALPGSNGHESHDGDADRPEFDR